MKIGLVTTSEQRYSVVLLYYLISKSIKPSLVLVVKANSFSRLKRNFNFTAICNILNNTRFKRTDKHKEPTRDYLTDFVRSNLFEAPQFSIISACKRENVNHSVVNGINCSKVLRLLRKNKPDIFINAGGGIFRSEFISSIKIGVLNAHMGRLPYFRGMNVLEWSLLYNEELGVTLHFIDRGIDTGDILLFKNIPIRDGDTIEDLRIKAGVIGLGLIYQAIEGLSNGTLQGVRQDRAAGRQYFALHERLRIVVEGKLKKYQSL